MEALYPLADTDLDGWHADGDYLARGALLQWMEPRKFIKQVRPLDINEISRKNIEELKLHIRQGGKLDPLKIDHINNREDGRRRAHAMRGRRKKCRFPRALRNMRRALRRKSRK